MGLLLPQPSLCPLKTLKEQPSLPEDKTWGEDPHQGNQSGRQVPVTHTARAFVQTTKRCPPPSDREQGQEEEQSSVSTPQSHLAVPTCRAPLYLAPILKDIPELENLRARKKLTRQLAQSQGQSRQLGLGRAGNKAWAYDPSGLSVQPSCHP